MLAPGHYLEKREQLEKSMDLSGLARQKCHSEPNLVSFGKMEAIWRDAI